MSGARRRLSDEQVAIARDIYRRRLEARRLPTLRSLAKQWGVSVVTIWRMVRGETYKR